MKILAIDPGLDATGWAVFDVDRYAAEAKRRDPLVAALGALLKAGTWTTKPSDDLARRLNSLCVDVGLVLTTHEPAVVYVEEPAYSGDYKRHGKGARAGTNKLYMALGALISEAHGFAEVILLPAPGSRKDYRHDVLELAARSAGVKLPEGPRGGKREDAWDAILLGAMALGRKDATR